MGDWSLGKIYHCCSVETNMAGGANKDMKRSSAKLIILAKRSSTKCNGVNSMRGGIDVRRNGFRSNR